MARLTTFGYFGKKKQVCEPVVILMYANSFGKTYTPQQFFDKYKDNISERRRKPVLDSYDYLASEVPRELSVPFFSVEKYGDDQVDKRLTKRSELGCIDLQERLYEGVMPSITFKNDLLTVNNTISDLDTIFGKMEQHVVTKEKGFQGALKLNIIPINICCIFEYLVPVSRLYEGQKLPENKKDSDLERIGFCIVENKPSI